MEHLGISASTASIEHDRGWSSFRRRSIFLAAVALTSVLAGIAYAYFTSSGTGTGNARVGTSASWAVQANNPVGVPLLPGYGSQNISYTVTNTSDGYQKLMDTAAALTTNAAGDVYDVSTSSIAAGCKAAWYTVVNDKPALVNLAGGAVHSGGNVTIQMLDSNTNQDACKLVSPQVTIDAT
jgi:hypothetical protein